MITKLASVIKNLGPAMRNPCSAITAAAMILREGEHPAEVREQIEKLAKLQREFCDSYNKLRSLVGDCEAADGIENPTFYVKPYVETGEPICRYGTCTCGRLIVDLAALKPSNKYAGEPEGHVQHHECQHGRERDQRAVQDELDGLHARIVAPFPEKSRRQAP